MMGVCAMRFETRARKGAALRKNACGFSLIELLIVVAIILIITAIAIPNFMRSRMAANQASAVQSLRVINTAEVTYSSTYQVGFSSTLAQLGPPTGGAAPSKSSADLIDGVLAAGDKSGYSYVYSPALLDASGFYNGYVLNGDPTVPGSTGTAYYFTDQTGVIRASISGPATASDSPVAQ